MSDDPSSSRYPITFIRERAARFAAVDATWDEAAWERSWGTPIPETAVPDTIPIHCSTAPAFAPVDPLNLLFAAMKKAVAREVDHLLLEVCRFIVNRDEEVARHMVAYVLEQLRIQREKLTIPGCN